MINLSKNGLKLVEFYDVYMIILNLIFLFKKKCL